MDPFEKRLKPIVDDSAPEGLPIAWNMKHYGDMGYYPSETKNGQPYDCHGCSFLKCMTWPGWV